MLFTVVRVYQQGRKLSEAELRSAQGVVGDVGTHSVPINGGSKQALPPLIEPRFTGMSKLALGLEGYEEVTTPVGVVFYRQGWWCRVR